MKKRSSLCRRAFWASFAAAIQIGESEQHAWFFGNGDRFASDDNQPVASGIGISASRWRMSAALQLCQCVLTGVAFEKQAEFLDTDADDLFHGCSRHFKEALIGADSACPPAGISVPVPDWR